MNEHSAPSPAARFLAFGSLRLPPSCVWASPRDSRRGSFPPSTASSSRRRSLSVPRSFPDSMTAVFWMLGALVPGRMVKAEPLLSGSGIPQMEERTAGTDLHELRTGSPGQVRRRRPRGVHGSLPGTGGTVGAARRRRRNSSLGKNHNSRRRPLRRPCGRTPDKARPRIAPRTRGTLHLPRAATRTTHRFGELSSRGNGALSPFERGSMIFPRTKSPI
jgi:hypothetical protein